jgi:HPt (histidine-containing phosphotransfer) domain-containing protein
MTNSTLHPLAQAANEALTKDCPVVLAMLSDRVTALRRLGGDQRLYQELARLFLEDSPRLMQHIVAASQRESWAELQRGAHSIKGLAAGIGASVASRRVKNWR